MKKLMLTLAMIMLLCTAAVAQEAFAPKGSAIVTGLCTRSGTWTDNVNIYVTNISGSEISCKVIVFDHDGKDITSHCNVLSGSPSANTATTIAAGTGSFNLSASATRVVNLPHNLSGMVYGHAVIEWTSTDPKVRKALISTVKQMKSRDSKTYGFSTPVNNGQPF